MVSRTAFVCRLGTAVRGFPTETPAMEVSIVTILGVEVEVGWVGVGGGEWVWADLCGTPGVSAEG